MMMRRPAAFAALAVLMAAPAAAQGKGNPHDGKPGKPGRAPVIQNGCPAGTWTAVQSPDGTSLSILFDTFLIELGRDEGRGVRMMCNLRIPLNLPEGYSLGVYRVDYRGFALLGARQDAQLTVDYGLGPRGKGRKFRREIKGAREGDFSFRENIGAGLMKRVGCGEAAVLNLSAALEVHPAPEPAETLVALDSADGASKGGLVYHFNLKKCRE